MQAELSVIITRATGTAGSGVLHACLQHPAVSKVTILTRRSIGIEHEKLTELIHDDFLNYESIESEFHGFNACFWCLGVSQAKVRNEGDYKRITYDFTMEAAKVLERLNPGMTFCFLTGMGTDETQKSRMMWARILSPGDLPVPPFLSMLLALEILPKLHSLFFGCSNGEPINRDPGIVSFGSHGDDVSFHGAMMFGCDFDHLFCRRRAVLAILGIDVRISRCYPSSFHYGQLLESIV